MLSKEEVQHIALLARIGLKDDEIEKYQKDLSSVLDFVKALEEVDTNDVEVVRQITGRENSWRGDRLKESDKSEREAIIENFPEEKDNFLKVKSVF